MDKTLIVKKGSLLLWFLCLLVGVSAIATNYGSSLRYTKYLIPPVFLLFAFFGIRKLKIYASPLKNLLLFSSLIALNLIVSIISFDLSFRFFEESLLILLPILSVILITTVIKKPVGVILDHLFFVYAIIFIVTNINFFFNVNIINDFILALTTSTLKTESWMAFPFGLFTIFYLIEKRKKRAIISVILFLLAFKRISILGAILGLSIYWFFSIRNKRASNKKNVYYWFIFLNFALLIIVYNFIQGNFDELITNITGISPNWFTQGRLRVYTDTLNHFSSNLLFGNSLGSTNLFLTDNFENISFLHSDILKIIIEMGFISYLVWVFGFFKINLVNKKVIPLLVFMNLLFLSDNVFIYFDTLFIFYLLIIYYSLHPKRYEV
ncbi:hypothetical protein [Winogradskyella endarachnes]|uniref:O-antigen ligase domain-containing protein n=1 Tax=Winogradskyella endarachnes TaxID=2681965 RepID=A0A6L6U9Q1_9FLAO|nr:hypothetical protein [Winogradskyella endarachnes]MUU79060.1 hypothetical protein [Winogradskyella endarachnes]